MILLALQIAAAKDADLNLDRQLLEWAEAEGFFEAEPADGTMRSSAFLKHCLGLTGNLTGAHEFVRMLMPAATLSLFWSRDTVHATVDLTQGRAPRTVGSPHAANALIAAALTAWSQDRLPAALVAAEAPSEPRRRA